MCRNQYVQYRKKNTAICNVIFSESQKTHIEKAFTMATTPQTPPPTAAQGSNKENITDLATALEKLQDTEDQLKQWMKKCESLKARSRQKQENRFRGRGKNTLRLSDMLRENPQNLMNYSNVSSLITNSFFNKHKFLNAGWKQWSTTRNTICHRICGVVAFPKSVVDDEGKEEFWQTDLVPMVNKKMSCLKGNVTQKLKKVYFGKPDQFIILSLTCFIVINY